MFRSFNGEIISADAMQMYKGLNVITNKVKLPFKLFVMLDKFGTFMCYCYCINMNKELIKNIIEKDESKRWFLSFFRDPRTCL